jgi:hypothetical protein
MIGNENDARTAYDEWLTGSFDHLFSSDGSSRYVFLIDGIIYKVNVSNGYIWDANKDEYNNAQTLAGILPANVRIPEMSLYTVDGYSVLAAELITGTITGECSAEWTGLGCEDGGVCLSDNLISELRDLGWDDSCWGNAIRSGNIIYLVDVA